MNTVTKGGNYDFEGSSFSGQFIDIYTPLQKNATTNITVNKDSHSWLEINYTYYDAVAAIDIYNGSDSPDINDPSGSTTIEGNLKIIQDATGGMDTRVISVLTGNHVLTINGDLDLAIKGGTEHYNFLFGEVIRSYGSEININGNVNITNSQFSSNSVKYLFAKGIYAANDLDTGIEKTNINIGNPDKDQCLIIQNLSSSAGKAEVVNALAVFAEGIGSEVNIYSSASINNISATGPDSASEILAGGLTTYGGKINLFKDVSIEKIIAQGEGSLATGIEVYPGEVKVSGDLVIAGIQGADSYSLFAINDSVTDSAVIEAKNAARIEGDVFAKRQEDLDKGNGSKITLGFDGVGKYLKAFSDVDEFSSFDLTLSNNARWEIVTSNPLIHQGKDSYESSVTTLSLNGGKVFVGSTESGWNTKGNFSSVLTQLTDTDKKVQLKIKNLNGNGDFYLRSNIDDVSDNILVTESLSGNFSLNIKSTGQEPPELQENSYLARAESSVGATGSEFTLGGGKEIEGIPLIDIGVYNYKLDSSERNAGTEWYLVRTDKKPDTPDPVDPAPGPEEPPLDPDPFPLYSPTAEAVLAMAGMGAQSGFYQNQLTDVRKRLGEIRSGVRDGLWASVAGQKDRVSGFAGTNFKQNVYRFNFGIDRVVGDWILGGNFKYLNADQKTRDTYFRAKGEAHSEGLNLYATWQNDKGCYADFILSADRYHQRINNTMLDGLSVKGTYGNLGLGVSAEIGKKFLLDNAQKWFAEPQLQLSYYHVKGDNFTMSNGMKVEQGNFNSLTGRLGVAAGHEVRDANGKPRGQVYLRTGLKHEFLGKQTLHANDVKFKDKLVGTRAYYGFATDWNLAKNLKVYGHVERENGSHYTKEIEVMAGVKYSF